MRFTPRSIIFFFTLSMLAVFFFGFNAGKYISHVDTIAARITPTPLLTQTITPSPADKEFTSFTRTPVDDCGISFLLPSNLHKTPSASQEAQFNLPNSFTSIYINCQKAYVTGARSDLAKNASSSSSAIIAQQKTITYASDEASLFIIQNKRKQGVLIRVSHELEDLIRETLQLQ